MPDTLVYEATFNILYSIFFTCLVRWHTYPIQNYPKIIIIANFNVNLRSNTPIKPIKYDSATSEIPKQPYIIRYFSETK